ncbi:unnamed protein product [Didymodactylos carnosus]|uniref:Uncharacterized protein n=1 Tax=Didymodactylos carnosus TaxID=1234261 RepID=A0A815XEH8_9BILA|nr:unnamed protein product [Didymodactylos carnosus]CAF1556495.1 unnamed protein product [Didymodactylos carnosus]CAF3869785.1 unnamed protein product [Didymodactylos carnosus]CAF4417666.1 unnamed protein product [Didymodactylos carnosus]
MPAIRSKRRKSCAHHNDSKHQRAASPSQESDEELEKQVLRTALERTLNISTDPDSTKKQLFDLYKRNLHKLSPVPTAMYPIQANDLLQQLSTINFNHTNATSQPVTTAATTTTSAAGRTDDLPTSATAAAKEFIDTVRKFSRDTNPDPSHLLYGQPTTVAATVSDVIFVNPKLKSLILSGCYINLALLLLPYDGSQPKDFDIDTGKVLLLPRSSGDPRLRRILTLPEFLLVWSKYTTIFCEVYEQRR